MQEQLFRDCAIEHQKCKLHGDVLIIPSMSHSLITLLLVLWIVAVFAWMTTSQYARQETVSGWLEPPSGIVKVFSHQLTGRIEQVLATEGDQGDHLLNGSIAQNIACFATTIDMQKVVYCANLACVHDDIMQTNMQYNTLVGDMGSNLSGGQKQRIVLARALYKEPSILFLDEATSHLDISNETAINNHISKLSITRVIITHRPQTIQIADRVLLLDKGELQDVTQSIKTPSTTQTI